MSELPPSPPPRPSDPPPGYVAYGTPAAYRGWTKPVRGLGRVVVILQAITVAASIGVLAAQVSLLDDARDYSDDRLELEFFEDKLGAFYIAVLLSLLVSVASIVMIIIWSFRIAANLRQRGAEPTWKPGLTIVAWLLAGCTLNILPFLMLREHWAKSNPDVAPDPSRARGPMDPFIIGWFVLSLGAVAAGVFSGVKGLGGIQVGNTEKDVAETLSDHLPATLISGVLGIASAICLIFVVRRLTDRHAQATLEA
jgi:hypothetical protein